MIKFNTKLNFEGDLRATDCGESGGLTLRGILR